MRLSKQDYKLFDLLLKSNQQKTHDICKQFLKKNDYEVIDGNFYLLAEGNIPIVLIAHMDTVHEQKEQCLFLYDLDKNIATTKYTLGFDDKAGIAAIFKIIKKGYRPHIIFTHDEEIGGGGSRMLVNDYRTCPFTPTPKYMIQLDRRGTHDCVFYDDDNKEFIKYVESFNHFKEAIGSFTDISTIAPVWDISGVNLSIGYFNEHTNNEYLDVDAWCKTIDEVIRMINALEDAPSFNYIESQYTYSYSYGLDGFDDASLDYCECCGGRVGYESLIPLTTQDNTVMYVCPDCFTKIGNVCSRCGELYTISSYPDMGLCPTCYYDEYCEVLENDTRE